MFNWIIGIPLLTLFASVGLAIVVIPSTRHETGRFTLSILLALIPLWSFCSVMFHSISIPSTLFWLSCIVVCATYTGAVGVHFCVQFTERTGAVAKWVVRIFYILSSVLVILILVGKVAIEATLLPNGAVEVSFGPLAPVMWGIISLGTLIAVFILVLTLIEPLRFEKKYIIYTLVGFIAVCFGGLSNLFLSSYPVDIAANLIFISLITYGVVGRHMIRPAHMQPLRLSIPITGGMLLLCYAAMLASCLKWLGITTGTSHLVATTSVIIFGSMVFRPSRTYLFDKTKLFFFPNVYRYQKALSDLACVDRSVIRWGDSVVNILNIIAKTTGADDATLLVRNSKTKYFEVKHAIGHDPASMLQLSLPVDSPIVKTLAEKGTALSTGEIEREMTLKVILRGKYDTLQEIGPSLYCGVQGYDGLLAIVSVTHKSPHVWDRTEDRDFLELACRQIAPIIINADLYQESQLEIRERKQMEEELQRSRNQLLNLSRHLQSAREEERTTIAREIHDELGQALTALKMDLSWMGKRLPEEQESLREKAGVMSELIDTTIKTVKRISTQLRPGVLDDLGLIAAIEWQAEEFQERTGIKCKFNSEVEDIVRDRDLATAVFRILQETLTNVVRHSEATRVEIRLRDKTSRLVLEVRDNGKGITEEQLTSPGALGLMGIKERAYFQGGEAKISGVKGKGTTVTVTIPLDRKKESR